MSDISEVLERFRNDEAFRAQLETDPRLALRGYDLGAEDLVAIAAAVSKIERGDERPAGMTRLFRTPRA